MVRQEAARFFLKWEGLIILCVWLFKSQKETYIFACSDCQTVNQQKQMVLAYLSQQEQCTGDCIIGSLVEDQKQQALRGKLLM